MTSRNISKILIIFLNIYLYFQVVHLPLIVQVQSHSVALRRGFSSNNYQNNQINSNRPNGYNFVPNPNYRFTTIPPSTSIKYKLAKNPQIYQNFDNFAGHNYQNYNQFRDFLKFKRVDEVSNSTNVEMSKEMSKNETKDSDTESMEMEMAMEKPEEMKPAAESDPEKMNKMTTTEKNKFLKELLADGFGFEQGPPAPIAIASAIGGQTSLNALMKVAPLSPLGFAKLFVAILPFTVTLIFVPLFMFGLGVLLIPITRFHYYIDNQIRDDHSETGKFLHIDIDIDPDDSNSQNYSKNGQNSNLSESRQFFNLLPARFSWQNLLIKPIRRALSSHECVERFTCEFTTRFGSYLNNYMNLDIGGSRQFNPNNLVKSFLQITDHRYVKYSGRVISTLKNTKSLNNQNCKKYCCNPSRMVFEELS